MSYDLKRSHFSVILERKVATGSVITEEGVLLVATLDAATGEEVVDLSTGSSATEVVAGFAIRDNADNATTSAVEEGTIPAAGTLEVTLSNNNVVTTTPGDGSESQLRVVADSLLTLVDDGVPAGGQVAFNPTTGLMTFNAAEAGQAFVATYRYNLTVAEARLRFFQRNINNEAGALFGQVGVGHGHGEIFTDQYNALIDWSAAATAIESGPDGTLDSGGAGGNVLDARVISVPNVNNPLLGVAFSIGGATI
jgi:hypothetical protein